MKNNIFIFACFYGCCFASLSLQAGENIKVSSGGVVRIGGQVELVGVGAPVAGKGNGPIVGVGLPYMGKARTVDTGRTFQSVRLTAAGVKPETISSTFVLGEVYVYPNPAKGGKIPTFHVEVGIADSVKITIYTVSGDVAHSYTVTGSPAVINDGHGLEYAYEYAWCGHIPSGVYYYAMEAQKAGKKLRQTGKFAVVR